MQGTTDKNINGTHISVETRQLDFSQLGVNVKGMTKTNLRFSLRKYEIHQSTFAKILPNTEECGIRYKKVYPTTNSPL